MANVRVWHSIIRSCMLHGRKSIVPATALTQLQHTYQQSPDKTRALVTLGRAGYSNKISNTSSNTLAQPLSIIEQREKLLPDYQPLIAACGRSPEGVRFIMNMRQDCLKALRSFDVVSDKETRAWVKALEHDLHVALSSWFSAGLAKIHRVTWQHSSGELLGNLRNFEAVHKITSDDDLKHRLNVKNRRVFAFCHPVIGLNEPLVVLYVALTDEISNSVDHLIRDRTSMEIIEKPTTAIFYSISSHANNIGLAQVDLGNHMIKNAVNYLRSELPSIDTFSTLSPIPGLRKWMRSKSEDYFVQTLLHIKDNVELESFIRDNDETVRKYVKEYLYDSKRRGQALDGVANFHLRNGAAIFRVNTLANTTDKGMHESFGYMVNYKYDLDEIEARQEDYHFNQKINLLEPFKSDF